MALTPHKVEWLLGRDKHNRRVSLIREEEAGQPTWRIHREAASQLDQSTTLYDLTVEILVEAGKIAGDYRKAGR